VPCFAILSPTTRLRRRLRRGMREWQKKGGKITLPLKIIGGLGMSVNIRGNLVRGLTSLSYNLNGPSVELDKNEFTFRLPPPHFIKKWGGVAGGGCGETASPPLSHKERGGKTGTEVIRLDNFYCWLAACEAASMHALI